ncbi:hypothetical protein BJX68DRAFT_225345 [Aspergillus pseudodeflectus]|uniref:Uncharacterized protein n=1 Tax=Aspergillus pseudodeflectus TaxID=176178 RepID=A0ABR4L7F1_9EURO
MAAPMFDPALEKPSMKTDMCRNIDLPFGAFDVNHLVSRRLLLLEENTSFTIAISLSLHHWLSSLHSMLPDSFSFFPSSLLLHCLSFFCWISVLGLPCL